MPWGKIDDQFYDHPKLKRLHPRLVRPVARLSERQVRELLRLAAIGLHVKAISWSNRYLMDGHISTDVAEELTRDPELAEMLVAGLRQAELWDPNGSDDDVIHDYAVFNKTRAEVEVEREQRRLAGRAGGLAKRRGRGDMLSGTLDDMLGGSPSDVPDGTPSEPPSGVAGELLGGTPGNSPSKRPTNARARPVPSHDVEIPPTPAASAGVQEAPVTEEDDGTGRPRTSPRANGTNPRALGTNPRAEDQRLRDEQAEEAKGRAQRHNARQQAYLRGRITEAELDALARADEPPPDRPDGAAYASPAAIEP